MSTIPLGEITASDAQRFWAKVDSTGECWTWLASLDGKGYGRFMLNGKVRKAHRVAYEMVIGPIPVGKELDHAACNERACVRPAHLRPATRTQNARRRLHGWSVAGPDVTGVFWDKRRNHWFVRITFAGKDHRGGTFADLEDAKTAARALRIELLGEVA